MAQWFSQKLKQPEKDDWDGSGHHCLISISIVP